MWNRIKSIFNKENSPISKKSVNNNSLKEESYIKITEVSTNKNRVDFKFETSEDMDKYFIRKHMYSEYMNRPDIDLNSIPKSILIIPIFTNLLPVSWLCDCKLIVDNIDKTLYQSLNNIKEGYSKMYPSLSFKGSIEVKNVEDNTYEYEHESISLFTYGVDSLTTVLRHLDEKSILTTIWGADIHLSSADSWNNLYPSIDSFSKDFNLENIFIKSDFRQFMDTDVNLKNFLLNLDNNGNWWYTIQHGIALLGQVSVLAYYYRVKHVLIASSHSYAENEFLNKKIIPCASSPFLDNEFKFASCSTIHDSYDLSRPDKLDLIMNYSKKSNVNFNLHVCWLSKTGFNCCVCEKCSRTLMYILAKNENPKNYGFDIDDEVLKTIERNFKKNLYDKEKVPGWSMHPVTLSYWKCNQEAFKENYDYWKDSSVSWILMLILMT